MRGPLGALCVLLLVAGLGFGCAGCGSCGGCGGPEQAVAEDAAPADPRQRTWNQADAEEAAHHLVGEAVKQGWVEAFKAESGGKPPMVELAIELTRLVPEIDRAQLRNAFTAELSKAGLEVRPSLRFLHSVTKRPDYELRFREGSPSAPSSPGPHFFFSASVDPQDEPPQGREGELRTVEVQASVVVLGDDEELWRGSERFERRPGEPWDQTLPPLPPCTEAPSWTGLPACLYEGYGYAVAKRENDRKQRSWDSLPSSLFALRPEKSLLEPLARAKEGKMELYLELLEVIDSYQCAEATYTLVRTDQREVLAGELPECDPVRVQSRSVPPPGCPDWSNKVAWQEGTRFFGVARTPVDPAGFHGVPGRTEIEARMNVRHMLGETKTAWLDGDRLRFSFGAESDPVPQLLRTSSEDVLCSGLYLVRFSAELGKE